VENEAVKVKDTPDRSGIQVIARAASILRTLKDDPSGLSLGRIAEKVNLPRSTVQRIVGALAAERMVISDQSGGGLRLGPELGRLAQAARFNVVERCRLILTELTQDTGETADLAVMSSGGMVFLDQVPGLHRLRTVSAIGEVFALTTTANGRACLAAMPEDKAINLIQSEWQRSGTKGDLENMLSRLQEIRKIGLAYDIDEHTPGISAIGFAFADWGGELHAISVPVPSTRFVGCRETVEQALRRAKDKIAALVTGYEG
jgi:DNA-binding IclR family transcriptional regulator